MQHMDHRFTFDSNTHLFVLCLQKLMPKEAFEIDLIQQHQQWLIEWMQTHVEDVISLVITA